MILFCPGADRVASANMTRSAGEGAGRVTRPAEIASGMIIRLAFVGMRLAVPVRVME